MLWTRRQVYFLNRSLVLIVLVGALGTLFLQPHTWWQWSLDLLFRSYLIFVGSTLAHESSHFHLGATSRANLWWGRLAVVPSTVPALNFRMTHLAHHAYTNIPEKDPDYFLKPNHAWEIPFRCLGLPHWWLLWLFRNGKIGKKQWVELVTTYLVYGLVYGAIISVVGVSRVAWGVLPALFANSILLWYFFAVKTHDGYSTGHPDSRSHNYYGRWIYWFSVGLSMHRVHHLQPKLGWIEILPFVEEIKADEKVPGTFFQRFGLKRNMVPDDSSSALT